MRVLIFHGYLLRGTGSNVYNASLARALARLGHEVHLLCQDRDAGSLDWVDRLRSLEDGRLQVEPGAGTSPPGSVTAYLPDIGGLLPVYVADRYEGFGVKTFPELTEAELDRYLEANVAAVRDVVEALGGVDAALANHLVMGPGDPRPGGPRLRGQGPRLGPRVHGEAGARALPALRARGHRGGGRGPGRLPPYGREPLGGARRPRACPQDPARPAGGRHGALPAAGTASRRQGVWRSSRRASASEEPGRRRRVRPRPAGGRGRDSPPSPPPRARASSSSAS